jgi:hypothetical protein
MSEQSNPQKVPQSTFINDKGPQTVSKFPASGTILDEKKLETANNPYVHVKVEKPKLYNPHQ